MDKGAGGEEGYAGGREVGDGLQVGRGEVDAEALDVPECRDRDLGEGLVRREVADRLAKVVGG